MKQHEREYFISRIRLGIFTLNEGGLKLKVYSPKIEDGIIFDEVYMKAYGQTFEEGIMDEEETLKWMREKNLWNEEDEVRLTGLEKDIERLKIEIYNSKYNLPLVDQIRFAIRKGEEQLLEQKRKKTSFFSNTCEGIAALEKARAIIKHNTFLNNELYDFSQVLLDDVLGKFQNSFYEENTIRELACNEPWKIVWYMKDVPNVKLFVPYEGRELTHDQKNIIIWSRMYDNIQESTDCPRDDIIKDHDMLDGWFIIQRKKRDKEKSEKEFEDTTGGKISQSDEIFVVSQDKKNTRRIKDMNDINAQMTIKEREKTMKQKGKVNQGEFKDVKLDLRNTSHQQYKEKFRR